MVNNTHYDRLTHHFQNIGWTIVDIEFEVLKVTNWQNGCIRVAKLKTTECDIDYDVDYPINILKKKTHAGISFIHMGQIWTSSCLFTNL